MRIDICTIEIFFPNKDGEKMEKNPTDGNKNYFVKTVLIDTKAPTCGMPTTPGTYTIKIKAKDPAGNESE
mgnify:FL=1